MRIIGGHSALIAAYPYQVAVFGNGILACGGSIIGTEWVLTAAHCVEMRRATYNVRVGSTFHGKDGRWVDAKRTIMHERYHNQRIDFDFGLIQLNERLVFSDSVKPIALAQSTTRVADNANAVVTGWGATGEVC